MTLDTCALSTPAWAALLFLPSVLAVGVLAASARLVRASLHPNTQAAFPVRRLTLRKLATANSAPLLAGTLASLLIARDPAPAVLLVIGALAAFPLIATLYTVTRLAGRPEARRNERKDKPRPLNSPSLLATKSSSPPVFQVHTPAPSPVPSIPGTPADTDSSGEYGCGIMATLPRAPASTPAIGSSRTPSLSLSASTAPTSHSSLSSLAASSPSPRTSASAPAAPRTCDYLTPALEDEFVRLLLRSTRANPNTHTQPTNTPANDQSTATATPPKPYAPWPEHWPVYWEGAGLAPRSCW